MRQMLTNIFEWVVAILVLLAVAGIIFAVTTAHAQPRPVQLWTLWETDDTGAPARALLRFTSLDACIAASYRYGFTTGETAACYPYRLGDFR